MKFKDLLRIVRSNAILIALAAVFGGLATTGVSLIVPPTYTAKADLFVSVRTSNDPAQMQSASTFIQERMQTYVRMVDDRTVLEPVIKELGLSETPEELGQRLSASSETGTVLITVEADAENADAAAELGNAVSRSLVSEIEYLEGTADGQNWSLKLVISNPAVPPLEADGMGWWMSGILGVFLGFSMGVGLALLLNMFDTKLRTKDDVERLTRTPILAGIPANSDLRERTLDLRKEPFSVASESFRRLRTNLQFARIEDENRAVLVTSSQAGEGKTTTSINLAIAMAQKGQKVALVDVDLRAPAIAERLGLENSVGLTSALVGEADVADLLQPWGMDELYVLTAGDRPPNPTEILDSRAMSQLLARLLDEFDSVILDAPPTLPVADSLVIGKHVGRIVVVVGMGDLRDRDLAETLGSLKVVGAPVSLVLNRVPPHAAQTAGYYSPYFSPARTPIAVEEDQASRGSRIGDSEFGQTEPARSETAPLKTASFDAFGINPVEGSSRQQSCKFDAAQNRTLIPGMNPEGYVSFERDDVPSGRRSSELRTKNDSLSRRQILARERKQP